MLPANIVSALQVLSRSDRPLIAAAVDSTQATVAKLEPGQQLQATVQAKLSEGLFKVQVAGQTLQMRLPGEIKSGDILKLEVISTQPKITFSIVASTSPLATPDRIGTTAQLLSNLAELPMERRTVQQLGSKAVWQSGLVSPDAKLLANALRDALGKSGLFYESHQAQWIRGERSTDQLLEEPQNILTGKNLPQTASETKVNLARVPDAGEQTFTSKPLLEGGKSATLPNAGQEPSTKPIAPGRTERIDGSGQTSQDKIPITQSNSTVTSRHTDDAPLSIARELLPLVQQQLHTLEYHHLVWMGQVWPGQQMQWEIQGEPENEARQPNERQWSTEMELALPRLGGVHARLVLAEGGLRLTLNVADPDTAALFSRNLPMLKSSLAEANIPLSASVVESK